MENYGYYQKRQRRGKSVWGKVLRIADILMLLLTAVCTLLLLAAYIARYINPCSMLFCAFAGLLFPIFYAAELLLGLWWVIRWKRYAIVVGVILLAGIGAAGRFYRPDFKRHYEESGPSRSELVVMSYNVQGFSKKFAVGDKSTAELIAGIVTDNNVDIVCFQEMGNLVSPEISDHLQSLEYNRIYPYAANSSGGDKYSGLAIYSRYPIVRSDLLPAGDSERNFGMWADIRIVEDTVRVFNVHLNSTHINNDEVDYISSFHFVSDDTSRRASLGEIVSKLGDNYQKRAPQAKLIGSCVEESPYPVILCGDFNDTPASYAYHEIVSAGLRDAFVAKGRGISGTYGGFFNMFRIDYVMASRGVNVTGYYDFDNVYSDHMPVAAGFGLGG